MRPGQTTPSMARTKVWYTYFPRNISYKNKHVLAFEQRGQTTQVGTRGRRIWSRSNPTDILKKITKKKNAHNIHTSADTETNKTEETDFQSICPAQNQKSTPCRRNIQPKSIPGQPSGNEPSPNTSAQTRLHCWDQDKIFFTTLRSKERLKTTRK